MKTAETKPTGIDPEVLADLDAVMKRITDGTPVDAQTSRRIEERADRILPIAGNDGAHDLELPSSFMRI
jgi:hypothetical protein